MKKTIFIALLAIFSLSATTTFAASKNTTATEMRLSSEEMNNYKTRVEEIREMDKSNMSALEKKELKNELKDIKATMRSQGPYIYIGGTSLLLIIILLIILL